MDIKTTLTSYFYRGSLILKKKSPEILLISGVSSMLVGTILACKATLKVDEITKTFKDKEEKINFVRDTHAGTKLDHVYTEEDKDKDLALMYVQRAAKYIELYLPAAGFTLLGIGLIVGGHQILSKRNAALIAAYKILDTSFKRYRDSVKQENGEDVDNRHRFEKTSTNPETGEVTTKIGYTSQESDYARWFDEHSTQWRKTHEYNLYFLKGQQAFANDLLQQHGHIFLNEVYDMLGLERSQAGAIVGWVKDNKDGAVDFGLWKAEEHVKDMINPNPSDEFNPPFLLDFNVDGIIYDLI